MYLRQSYALYRDTWNLGPDVIKNIIRPKKVLCQVGDGLVRAGCDLIQVDSDLIQSLIPVESGLIIICGCPHENAAKSRKNDTAIELQKNYFTLVEMGVADGKM